MNWANVTGLTIPKGNVVSIQRNGQTLWQAGTTGLLWQEGNATGNEFSYIVFGNGIWLAVETVRENGMFQTSQLWRSEDGKSWEALEPTGLEFADDMYRLVFGDGMFVASCYGSESVYASIDGQEWTAKTSFSQAPASMAYHSVWKIVTNDSDYTRIFSSDLVTTGQFFSARSSGTAASIKYSNGMWLCKDPQNVMWSEDGFDWELVDSSFGKGAFEYGKGVLVFCTYSNVYWTDKAGEKTPVEGLNGVGLSRILCAGDLFVGGTQGNGLFWSEDGKTWHQANNTAAYVTHLDYSDGLWIAATSSGLLSSEDGKTWHRCDGPKDGFDLAVPNGDIWVAGGGKGLWWHESETDEEEEPETEPEA